MLTKICSKKTKASFWNPKKININFENSIEKEFKILDLESINYVNFFITNSEDEDERKLYKLQCEVLYKNANGVKNITLGTFFRKNDAENALSKITVACYYPNKMRSKFLIGIVGITLLGLILFKFVFGWNAKIYPTPPLPVAGVPNMSMSFPEQNQLTMSPEKIQEIIDKTQKELSEQEQKGKQSIIDDRVKQAEQINKDLQELNQEKDPADAWLEKLN